MCARQKQEKEGCEPYTCGTGSGLTPKAHDQIFLLSQPEGTRVIFLLNKSCVKALVKSLFPSVI
jgi:hypothetical protein